MKLDSKKWVVFLCLLVSGPLWGTCLLYEMPPPSECSNQSISEHDLGLREGNASFSDYIGSTDCSWVLDEDARLPSGNLVKAAAASNFITRWNTTKLGASRNNQIRLPLESTGTYNFTVDWGDGSTDQITVWNQPEVTHTYATPGEYIVTINSTLHGWSFIRGGDHPKLVELSQWGDIRLGNSGRYFYWCRNLVLTATDAPDLTGTTSLAEAFLDCYNLGSTGDMNNWNVSAVTDMSSMFFGARTFNQPLGAWNVSAVTKMDYMFSEAWAFNQPLGVWNVSAVTTMSNMFFNARAFNQPVEAWNVSAVTSMSSMFARAEAFNQPLEAWDVSAVRSMNMMFESARTFNQPIGGWNVSSVTSMRRIFNFATKFDQPLGDWNVSAVTNMNLMFSGARDFDQPLGDWNVSAVTIMSSMFVGAWAFNQPLEAWDVSSVTMMDGMFSGTTFNQPLGAWDVSAVTEMSEMFHEGRAFDQPLGDWNVSAVTSMHWMFRSAGLSWANYDHLLLGWAQLELNQGVPFTAGNSWYTRDAASARQHIIDTYGWTISDRGLYEGFVASIFIAAGFVGGLIVIWIKRRTKVQGGEK